MPERGFLVVGAVPWPAPRSRRWWPALAAVAVALAAIAGSAFWFSRPPVARQEAPRPAVAPSTLASPVAAAATAAPSPVTLPPPVERPYRAPETAPARALPAKPEADARPDAVLRLEAIGARDGGPVAVVSGRLVREGDRYDGITIVRIGADEVEIEVQGQRRTLRF